MEEIQSEDMMRGAHVGVYNSRGGRVDRLPMLTSYRRGTTAQTALMSHCLEDVPVVSYKSFAPIGKAAA